MQPDFLNTYSFTAVHTIKWPFLRYKEKTTSIDYENEQAITGYCRADTAHDGKQL